ncbi:leucine-rich repeat protein [Eggerthella timonensis]|uniref:leucine-rich repeat protein n=1 Tax=Eggerthella timonensis TaxID=1871008 RepID=UPI0015E0DE32|nr:leucine-rich repeat protein [Eggerthella timonensis]
MEDEVKLDPPAVSEPSAPPAEPSTGKTEDTKAEVPAEPSAGQTAVDVPLASEAAKPAAGEIVQDGLVYRIDGDEAVLVGWRAPSLEGDVVVPATVSSGADSYVVTRVGEADADKAVLAGSSATSVSLPASVAAIEDGALAGCPSLSRISVSSKNESFASFDGMLFSKDLASLLLVPEGKEGAARIPDQTNAVPASAFSHCARLSCILVGEGSRSLASWNGLLFTNDMKTLVACPVGAGGAVVIPEDVEFIGSGAFAGCAAASITALGFVRDIAADAFDAEARECAVVALPAGDDYEARKAVWEAAGFGSFKEPAKPGDVAVPEPSEPEAPQASGLAYEVLGDYTLAVSWQGARGPEGTLEIPAAAEVGGVSYRVSAVADAGFAGRSGLTGVALPASVNAVGDRAFEATGVSDAWLPASVATVGERAFAACPSLERVVSLGSPWVADSALAECSGVSVYAPSDSDNPWNVGLPAAGNHLMPYGVSLAEEPLALEVGQSWSIIEGGQLDAPEPIETSYAYAAKPLSVDPDGTATGKAEGSSEVAVTLSFDGVELARASRPAEVAPTSEPEAPVVEPEAPVEPTPTENVNKPAIITETASLASAALEEAASLESEPETISYAAALATGETFSQSSPSGHLLAYSVLADDPTAVEVSMDSASPKLDGELVIPASVEHEGTRYIVKSVAAEGFRALRGLSSVSFSAQPGEVVQLETIGAWAFAICSNLKFFDFPDSLKIIRDRAFTISALRSVQLPEGLETLEGWSFESCVDLASFALGGKVTSLEDYVLGEAVNLRELVVGGSISTFSPFAFAAMSSPDKLKIFVPTAEEKTKWEAANSQYAYGFDPANIIVSTANRHTVTFEGCGGFPEQVVQSVASGQPIVDPGISREGFGLEGWYLDEGCSIPWDIDTPVNEDTVLYANWVENATENGFSFVVRPDGGLTVVAVDPSKLEGDVSIPASHRMGGVERPVAEIGYHAFYGAAGIRSVAVPDSVEEVGFEAFVGCSNLEKVDWSPSSSLKSIGMDAFTGCASLESLFLPASLRQLTRAAFYRCSSLKTVVFGEGSSIESIGDRAFGYCSALSEVNLPQSVKRIENHAFGGCSALQSIELPEGLEFIGQQAFQDTGLTSMDVPSSVTAIKMYAFDRCSKLAAVSLPAGLKTLDPVAFRGCTALAAVSAHGLMDDVADALKPSDAEHDAFPDVDKSKVTVVLPATGDDGSTYDQMVATWSGYGFSKFSPMSGPLPTVDGGENARWTLDADGTLRIECTKPGAVIEDLGWADTCSDTWWGPVRAAVKAVVVDSGVDAVDMVNWFAEMPNLVSVGMDAIPQHVQSVVSMFSNSSSLKSLPDGFTIPDTVTECRAMFFGCSSLESLPAGFRVSENIAGGEGAPGLNNMFYQCASLASLPEGFEIPRSVTELSGMFLGCTSLTSLPESLLIPESVTGMHGMFKGCSSLRNLPIDFKIPSKAGKIGEVFNGCSSLEFLPSGFRILSTVEASMQSMFYGCTALRSLPEGFTLPETAVNTTWMFYNCTSLSSLPEGFYIPMSVTSDWHMFNNCTSLVALPDSFDLPDGWSGKDPTVFQHSGVNIPMYYAGDNPKVVQYPWAQVNRTLVKPSDKPANAKTVTLNVKAEGESGPGSYWTTAYTDNSGMLAEPVAPSRQGMVFALWYADEACTQRVDFSKPFAEDATIYGKLVAGTLGDVLPTEDGTGSAFWSISDDGTLYIRGTGKVSNFGWDWNTPSAATDHWGAYRDRVVRISMAPSVRAEFMRSWFMRMPNLFDVREVAIPVEASDISRLFQQCYSLETLPEGFTIPDGIKQTMAMFENCWALGSLPEGFAVADTVTNLSGMFLNCSSLSSLPEGFKLSKKADWFVDGVFENCSSLTSLPDSFTFTNVFYAQTVHRVFKCALGEGQPRVPMYYAGSDPTVLNYDWASQNRVLIADPADRDMREISYKLVNEDGSWSTRSTVLTGSDGMVPNVGEPQRDGYGFTGWCVDEECLVPFDFGEPVSEDRILYGKWVKHGGRDAKLPLVAGTQGDVWWRITVDGQLCIGGEGQVGDLGFSFDQSKGRVNYWDPFRKEITDILMEPEVKVPGENGMTAWFCWLPKLQTVDSLVIPEGTRNVQDLFHGCNNLKALHEDFAIPTSVESIIGMFNSCLSLEHLPQSFILRKGNLKYATWVFNACGALKALPPGFTIPEGVTAIEYFAKGSGLVSLPEGFDIPETLQTGDRAFDGIPTLRTLPGSLNLAKLPAKTKELLPSLFRCDDLTETYYPGDPANLDMGDGYWAKQNRTIVSTAPAGKTFVDLCLPDEAGAQKLWTRKALDANSSMGEPVAPGWGDHAFLGWYTDPDCTAKATFPLTLSGETSLYGKYVVTGGTLPTVRDGAEGEEASWSFDDGTLTIRCDVEGAAIDTLWQMPEDGNVNGEPQTKHWSPLRDLVTKVIIESNVRVRSDIRFWFTGMDNLSDLSEFRFPEGAADVTHTFARCTSLTSLPSDFFIPDFVTILDGLFHNGGLESLPATFTLPSGATNVNAMLGWSNITALPDGFVLPPSVKTAAYLFSSTPLEKLPSSFLLPEGIQETRSMFAECAQLASLPDGFKIPKNVNRADKMFEGCPSLAALPDGFCFDNPALLTDVSGMFKGCSSMMTLPASLDVTGIPSTCAGLDTMFKVAAGPLSTYVIGGDLSKLAVLGNDATSYWSTKYNRTLVTDPSDLGGAKPVTFKTKVVGEQEWTTWQTMLTDQAGALADPRYAGRFGYAFDGWYADADCTQKFVFGETPLPAEGVLYGTHSLIVKYEIPIEAQVTLNALGEVAPADVRMKSFTPVPLAITQVKCAPVNSSSDIMDSADLQAVAATLLPEGAKRPLFVEVGETAGTSSKAFSVPEAKPGAPGVFNYAIGLDIPDASKVKLWRDGWSTDLVTLEYTVAPA